MGVDSIRCRRGLLGSAYFSWADDRAAVDRLDALELMCCLNNFERSEKVSVASIASASVLFCYKLPVSALFFAS